MPNPKPPRDATAPAPTDDAASATPALSDEERARRRQRRQARQAALAQADAPGDAPPPRQRGEGEGKRKREASAQTETTGAAQRSPKRRKQVGASVLIKRLSRDVTKPNRRVALGQASWDPSRPKVCYLHIGMHKTGTTSVQASFARIGARDHWRYVHAGTPNASLGANTAFKAGDPLAAWQFRHENKSSDAARQIRSQVRSSFAHFLAQPANTYLLSAESLSKVTHDEARGTLDWLGQFVDRVVVVGYVRPVHGFLEGMAQQSVKGRGMNRRLTSVVLDDCYPGYRERFEPWEASVAREDFVLRLFDRQALHGGDVVLDLAQIMGIDLRADEVIRSNTSFTLDALTLYELFLNHGAASLPRNQRVDVQRLLMVALKSAGGERMRLASAMVDAVAAKHLDDIAWAESRLGQGTLHTPNDPMGTAGLTSLELDMTQPATPAMVAWFNELLGRFSDTRLPAQPTPGQVAQAVREIIPAASDLHRLLVKNLGHAADDDDDDAAD